MVCFDRDDEADRKEFEEYELEKAREEHLKNKHYKYKVVFDNGKPYEEFFDNDEDLRTALKNFYEKNKDNGLIDARILDDKEEDISESQFIEETIRDILEYNGGLSEK